MTNYLNVLANFDKVDKKYFDEYEIESHLREFIDSNKENISFELKSEYLAFGFIETPIGKTKTNWGTYFGPQMTWMDDNGLMKESPSIGLVTTDHLSYWLKRHNESVNPILKARYIGLIYDFSHYVTQKKADYVITLSYINSLLDIGEGLYLKQNIQNFNKLERALELSQKLNNKELIEKAKKSIIKLSFNSDKENKLGVWQHSYDLLFESNKGILSTQETEVIISKFEVNFESINLKRI
ncbi:hypothetical protein LC612_37645 [Nostoc sp. CHAB 5834]|nr:hypothetical protein [Nostoc sp. CHAB 5834]